MDGEDLDRDQAVHEGDGTQPADDPGPEERAVAEGVGRERTEEPDGLASGPVLAIFAHPDDAEIAAGGTLCKWAEAGRDVHLLVLTNGDRGSQDRLHDRVELARTRARETQRAGEVIGVRSVTILGVSDGELSNTLEVQGAVARVVRELRPTTVVACDPTAWFFGNRYYNHSDHRRSGEIALDSIFPGAGNPHFFAEQLAEGLEPWNVREVRLAWTLEPNLYEDVSGLLERKLAALAEHRSQIEEQLGFFREWLSAEAEENGRKVGVRHAEAFRQLLLA